MEHLVIRNAGLNNQVEVMDLRRIEVLSQSLIGRKPSPFAPDNQGQPKVHVGDLVWLAQSGYGVIGTLRITGVHQIAEVRSHEDIDTLKRLHRTLEATYWEDLRGQLPKLNGRVMYFGAVSTTVESRFTLAEQFRLNLPKNAQLSWWILSDPTKRAEYFSKQGQSVSAAIAEEEAGGEYGSITAKVRLTVAQIWKGECFGDRKEGEFLHYDHFVPKALGGPGIYAENIVPLPDTMNLVKQHKVVRGFADIAYQWKLLTEDEYQNWGHMFDDNNAVIEKQRDHVRRITAEIRNRPQVEQRRFYFQILEKGIGPRVRHLFAALNAIPLGA